MGTRFSRSIEEDVLMNLSYMSSAQRIVIKVRVVLNGRYKKDQSVALVFNMDITLYALALKHGCFQFQYQNIVFPDQDYVYVIGRGNDQDVDACWRFLLFAYFYYNYYVAMQMQSLILFESGHEYDAVAEAITSLFQRDVLHTFFDEQKYAELFFETNWKRMKTFQKHPDFVEPMFKLAYKMLWAEHLNRKHFNLGEKSLLDLGNHGRTHFMMVHLALLKRTLFDQKYCQLMPHALLLTDDNLPTGNTELSFYFLRLIDYMMKKVILPFEEFCGRIPHFTSGTCIELEPKQQRVIRRINAWDRFIVALDDPHNRLMAILID